MPLHRLALFLLLPACQPPGFGGEEVDGLAPGADGTGYGGVDGDTGGGVGDSGGVNDGEDDAVTDFVSAIVARDATLGLTATDVDGDVAVIHRIAGMTDTVYLGAELVVDGRTLVVTYTVKKGSASRTAAPEECVWELGYTLQDVGAGTWTVSAGADKVEVEVGP